ncbi:type II toxin-antitoxin system Phd/YefM family antitoxin [Enterococcus sp. 669A]|uniref:Type II toxin-antitoxin system Phd/YefM family antitoxin n=1 Tax=Candidatus Enterococcus moelleringii TaxID=2815325 RepID=A0ABS3LDI3_9ENTE|nr:type II toxin-antitoxin system Phd/YefM family antitoxin [Enterococcus sp. 669A]MBO1307689.1 type II toxin-antitoxin system Phd/YefM family antitoxin [Enterococcus sp. 669A]
MTNIKPISQLRNYNKILEEVKPNQPLFLTENGHAKYAIVDIEEYEQFIMGLELFEKLEQTKSDKTYDNRDIMKEFGF